MENKNKPLIFCFIEGGSPGMYHVVALAEDGDFICGHCSSSEGYAKHDIGINSDWKHEHYKKKYPDGYTLVWLNSNELETNEAFLKAVELNQAQDGKD